ncbi:MAG: lytic murein transglycosylase B [Piscirickettsiaceae bacterium]|nr:MAG: lytic murein transglycosylase B [Piscirickettsiaceae bacterium]
MNRLVFKKFLLGLFLTTMLTSINACAAASSTQPTDPKVYAKFIDMMVEKHQFDRQELGLLLSKAKVQPRILKAMSSPAEKRLEWHSYRKIFVKPSRINGGVKFWHDNHALLQAAADKYGVPAEIIVAIIGVETRYGGNTGHFKVLDALSTLGFHFPKRSKFFTSELKHFLLLCREEGFDPLKPVGSYAGAMGQSQFIPSSYRAYAVDGDGDNKRDLWESQADIIFSVANYFAKHGWTKNQPITQPVTVQGTSYKELVNNKLKPKHTLQDLSKHQVPIPKNMSLATPVKLLKLKQATGDEYWLAFHNFYVITRYNHSALYAMAAYQLSQEIKKSMSN